MIQGRIFWIAALIILLCSIGAAVYLVIKNPQAVAFATVATGLTVFLAARLYDFWWAWQERGFQRQISYLEKQLTELYGPIYVLLEMNRSLLKIKFDPATGDVVDRVPEPVWNHVRDNILMPNNQEIIERIKKNIYLVEGPDIPESLLRFIVHAEIWPLRYKFGLDKQKYLEAFSFPKEFGETIATTTKGLKNKYYELIAKRVTSSKQLGPPAV